MLLNRQFLIAFFVSASAFNAAFAEENLDLNSHLAYVPPASSVPGVSGTSPNPANNVSATNQILLTNDSIVATVRGGASGVPPTGVQTSPTEQAQVPADLWQRIRNGFAMRELNSKLIARHERWYATHPDYVERMSERSQRYLYYITQEVERRGMPSEIALLPVIESAFNPGA